MTVPVDRASPPSGAAARSERQVIAYLAYMGILLAFGIDAALPAFDDLSAAFDLDEGSNTISLIVTFYFIGMAAGQLVWGPVSDRFGRRPALLSGIGLYVAGAILSILATSISTLLAARLVWGLGAAAFATLRTSIARDLYEGDQMARVIAVMMGVFMTGPILAPAAGEVILAVASWPWIFGAAIVLAAVLAAWTYRFGETLDPGNRQPLEVGPLAASFRAVFTNPVTARYTLALTASFSAFIIFLGSSQPIIDDIYGRGDQFALWFAVASVGQIVAFLTVNRFIVRFGSARVARGAAALAVTTSSILLVAALLTDGVPAFGLWFSLLLVANAFNSLLTPTCYSLGLAPMGERAGTASAVMGFTSAAGGAILAGLISARIGDTITPMAIGYVLYGGAAVLFVLLANRSGQAGREPVEPAARPR